MIKKITSFMKKETVLSVSAVLAILSMFFVLPNKEYVDYIDYRVLALLLCLMAVIAGFENIGVFNLLAEKLIGRVNNLRCLSLVLVLLCFFSAMLITNDVSLITFVPFAIMTLRLVDKKEYIIYVVVLQTIAANLGSMVTPIGNPHNLYLYKHYNVSIIKFIEYTAPIAVLALVLIIIMTLYIHNEKIKISLGDEKKDINSKMMLLYVVLFLLCLLTVVTNINYLIVLGIVLIAIIIFDRKILKKVDYLLLVNFICFFVFVGNISRIEPVQKMIYNLIDGREFIATVLICQGISNVPTAVLLSSFTENVHALILGTNVGGIGTIIASMASLISYKLYSNCKGSDSKKYLKSFTILNLGILIILILFTWLLMRISA